MKWIKIFEDFTNNGKFYLVIDDVNYLLNNDEFIQKGILHGLKGISANEDILNVLGTNCDIFIEMDENKVIAENNIIEVKYDDIELLSKNNFKLFKRVKGNGLNLLNDYSFFIEISHMIQTDEHHLYDLSKKNNKLYKLITSEKFITFLKAEQKNFNNIDEYTKYVCSFIENADFNKIKSDLSNMFLDMVEKYRYEQEWFILGDSFKVPFGSKIEVFTDFISDNIGEENVESCVNFFKELKNYKIIIE